MMHATGLDDCFVDADIRRAETLPPRAFVDRSFLEIELETAFRTAWVFVPQRPANELQDDPRDIVDLVRTRGARTPVNVAGSPLFIQRDWEGVLHAFPNVCTHAWHTLVQGPERDRSIVCPQHGRRFDTAGRYVSQTGFEGVEGMPRDCDHLDDLPVHEWGPFLFTARSRNVPRADDVFDAVRGSLGSLDIGAARRRAVDGEVRDLAGNWKQHAWNYMDALHIPFIHSRPGGLAEAVDLDSYRTELHGDAALQWGYAKDPAHGFDPALLPERFRDGDRRVFALWWLIFPNLTLNVYPWGLSVNLYAPIAGEPQRTRFHWYHYVWDDAKYAERDKVWMLKTVDDEDVDALTQVGRGVRSGLAVRGRFAPESEKGPHWFHRRVYEAVSGTR